MVLQVRLTGKGNKICASRKSTGSIWKKGYSDFESLVFAVMDNYRHLKTRKKDGQPGFVKFLSTIVSTQTNKQTNKEKKTVIDCNTTT